ncbi:hypothetical protein JCM10213v2_003342 [Rhodosporidiobolus nylandii]
MLDRLPPELLDLVLQLAAPPSTILDDWYGADHRATLRACALVCRRVSGVAQGLLWKDFALVGTDDVAKVWLALLKEGNRRRAMGTRTVLVGGPTDFEGLEALLPQFGGLVELRIDGGHSLKELSVAALAGLPNLRTLDVCDLTLNGDWANVCYPSLVRLHLDTVYFYTDAPASPTFFRQDAFPSLRALQLRDLGVDDGENYTRGFPTLPLPFLAQLDMLSLSALDLDVLPPSIFSSATPVVLEPEWQLFSLSIFLGICQSQIPGDLCHH